MVTASKKISPFVERLAVVNAVLPLFADGTRLEWQPGRGMVVVWKQWRQPTEIARRWMTSGGQDFYPPWQRLWGQGGTACVALSQLVRWASGKPCLSLSQWRWWTGEQVQLGRKNGPLIVELLERGGYPAVATCVLCGELIENGVDWWSLKGVSGPCCHHTQRAAGKCRALEGQAKERTRRASPTAKG